MKLLRTACFAATLLSAAAVFADSVAPTAAPRARISPHETISAVIGGRGGNRVTLTYGRPYSKDPKSGEIRKIWGNLVKWEKGDRLGADEATLLLTQQPLVFGTTTIPAGAYTLYIVPSEKGTSQLAFSSVLGKWGVPVDESKDVARVDLKQDTISAQVDQLTLAIVPDGNNPAGTLTIQWETTQYSAAFTVKK